MAFPEKRSAGGDLDALEKVYGECELTAYDRPSSKNTALHYRDCPDELARWLVGQGLDVDTRDASGNTPLARKVIWGDGVPVLLELGADVNTQDDHGHAPLHDAITRNPESVRLLIEHGADMTIYYASDFSSFCDVPPPLQYALQCCQSEIRAVAESARTMLDAGCPVPENAAEQVNRIGTALEFVREARGGENARADETDLAVLAGTHEAARILFRRPRYRDPVQRQVSARGFTSWAVSPMRHPMSRFPSSRASGGQSLRLSTMPCR